MRNLKSETNKQTAKYKQNHGYREQTGGCHREGRRGEGVIGEGD